MALFESGAERCVKKGLELLHCENIDIEGNCGTLEVLTSCRELVRKRSNQMLEIQAFVKKKVKIQER